MAGRADGCERDLRKEAGPGGDVEYTHARREPGPTQEDRDEVARDAPKNPIIDPGSFVVVLRDGHDFSSPFMEGTPPAFACTVPEGPCRIGDHKLCRGPG